MLANPLTGVTWLSDRKTQLLVPTSASLSPKLAVRYCRLGAGKPDLAQAACPSGHQLLAARYSTSKPAELNVGPGVVCTWSVRSFALLSISSNENDVRGSYFSVSEQEVG